MSEEKEFLSLVVLNVNTLWTLNPDYAGLIYSLNKRGYHSSRLQGVVAEKNDFRVTANLDRRVLGVSGNSSISVMNGFKELTEILEKEMMVNLKTAIIFYELIGGFGVLADHNPLDKLNSVFGKARILGEIGNLFDEEVAPFSLRFVPKGKHPDSLEWFDVTVEPVLTSPTSKYYIGVVYRSVNKDKLLKFLLDIEDKIIRLIEKIGGT